MAIRYQALTELYRETQRRVTSPGQWRAFLAAACRNYRLPFEEQLLVYAQRPDATAVLEIQRWNQRFGRWVNRGANGIAVFDGDYTGKPRLKYYFDVSDTREGRFPRPVPLWTVREEDVPAIVETLENSFGELEGKGDLGEALLSAAKNAVEDNMPDYLTELRPLVEDSFLEELDALNLEVEYRRAVQNSVGYMLLVRCGIDPSGYFEDMDFRDVIDFNTPQTLNALGVATGDISQVCLSAISRTVLALQRQPQKENRTVEPQQKNQYAVTEQEHTQPERSLEYDRDHLHQAGRLQSAEPSAAPGGAGSPWEIRIPSEEAPQGAPQGGVYESVDQRQAEQPSGGDPADRPAPDGADRGADGQEPGRDGGTEGQRPDEVGGSDEQPTERGGGNGAGGTDLQLIEEVEESAGGDELPALLDEKQIMAIIANKDDDLKYKKTQIELFFSVHSDLQERAEYLKSAYHDRYTEIIADGQRLGYKPQENGLLMWEGSYLSRTKESVFSWEVVAGWTAQLIDKKEYFIQTDIPQLPTQESQQMSLFDFAAFHQPAQAEGTAQPSIFPHPALPQQVIDEALCLGANDQNSRLIICAYFKKDKPDNARFLAEHYGENGAGFYLDGRQYAIWYNAEGLRIARGESAQRSSATLIPWEQAAARVRELLDLGRYMPQSELDRVDEYEAHALADQLLLMFRDIKDEEKKFFPSLRAIYDRPSGFPEAVEKIAELLRQEDGLRTVLSEYGIFAAAYQEDPGILRLRFYRPLALQAQLADLQREPLRFTAAEGYDPQRRFFISGDEIDNLLRGGKGNTDYRLAVYSFYRNHTERKERENFLKHYHGEYSGHSGGNDDVTYQLSKGISFSHGSITAPYAKVELKWPAVEKRVSAMIAQGRFLSEKDRAAMPQYEKHQLARSIRTFFEDVPQEQPHPYPFGFDYWDGVKHIEPQLDDPARVEELYQMMAPIWEATPRDDRMHGPRKRAFEDLTAFRRGTFTLFAEHKEPVAPAVPQAKTYDLGYGHLGNGLTVWNRLEEEHGDYKTVAHIAPDRTVTIYDEEMPQAVREEIQRIADTSELTISATQDAPVFSVPPRVQEPGPADAGEQAQKEEALPPPPKRPRRERITFTTLHPEIPRDQRHDFHITDDALGHGTPSEKYAANVAAIRTLKQIEAEERLATPEEQEILSRYVGWGGLANCFEQTSPHYEELKSLLDSEEYAAARASSLTAFYTPPVVIRGIYKALAQMGFTQGNILEPSCGTGNFLGLLPTDMAGSKAYGVELDSISGRIAGQLYQNASISVNGFETVQMPDSFFDVAVGNVPFGDFKVLDKRYDKHHWLIHDYFFGKTLDKVRPGGIVAFITSKGTLDKENSAVRKYLAQRADLIGAIRLPDSTFKRNAGTEVTSDIIFLQKRDRVVTNSTGSFPPFGEKFARSVAPPFPTKSDDFAGALDQDWVHLDTDGNGIRMNRYFVQHPEMILGDMVMESTRFGPDSVCKAREGVDLSQQLANAIQLLQAEIKPYELEGLNEEEDRSIPADPTVRNFSYTVVDGQLYYRENSVMVPVEVSVTAENRIRGMIELRECVRRLIEYQTEGYPDEEIAAEQQRLNALYDGFTAKYGLISSRGNKLAFSEDSSYCLLCSLEVLDEQGNLKRKADMFTRRTIRPHVAVTSVDTASEALAVSISEKARVDMDYMAELSGKSPEELEKELAGVIYRDIRCAENPEDILPSLADLSRYPLVTADEYLSGKVRQKLRMAKAFLEAAPAEQKETARKNVEALEAVQPQDLGAGEIGVRIGANWVPIDVYQQFMVELLTPYGQAKSRIKILRSEGTGQWSITEKNFDRANVKANTTYGTKRMSAYHILEQTLNQRDVRVFDYIEDEHGNKKPVLNKKETAIAQDRQELIKQKFAEWIWKDIDRRERLCRIYNETFNALRPREYDGRHIRFEGMNPEITLRPHQVNAIAHILYGGNTLLAHEVGAGKTYEMVAAAMEMKRLGLCTKSLIVVPNHITEQWAAEWLQLYPSANILVATKKDFETQNRKKFCSRIATGDYDAIIIGHSQFEKIPMSVERQQAILGRQIEEILSGIEQAKVQKAERYTIKQMERTRKSLETKLAKLNDQSRKDDVVTFEQLGVDRLFIDESHYFKNLFLATKMRNVGGIAQTEAQKSSDLFMKTQYLDELTGGRGVIFATGTPISNSMVELYTIQRYLQYHILQEMGLIHFDDWASNFGETVTAIELSPEGTGYRAKTRFAKFYNLPELMAAFKEVADIQTADMLKLPVPKANFHTEVIQPSELQKEMIQGLAERAEKIRGGGVDPHVDNMLRITNDGRKLALDMRLINPLAADDPNGKVAVCARNVFRIWAQTGKNRSAQLVFCDLSTPTADGSFNVYDDLKQKLMDAGIPEEEIAFIHTADSEAKKQALFAKVRTGQVRVLLGSTAKMGAGTNVQDRLIALHDLDCPWRPSDLQQRLGRIVRQGNENEEVEIYRYVTEGTFDAYLYQLVENKQKFIAQIMTSKAPVRVADDVDETALSYSEIKALATGNPLIIEKCNLDMEVARLNMLKASHLNQVYALEDLVCRKYPAEITRLNERITGYEQDAALAAAHPKAQEGFCGMEVEGRRYTEKGDAGKAILDVCTRMTGVDAVPLGQYRGFSMVLAYDGMSNEYWITLKGALSHTVTLGADVFGNITRMDNALENLSKSLEGERAKLDEARTQLKNARTELAAPFAREEELAEKTKRLTVLNTLLRIEEKDKTLLDDTPDEGEEVPARKVVELAR